jgi:hypothetical protein
MLFDFEQMTPLQCFEFLTGTVVPRPIASMNMTCIDAPPDIEELALNRTEERAVGQGEDTADRSEPGCL